MRYGREYIPYFRGVYMRDTLPKNPLKRECAVVNLDSIRGFGTHWVAYYKNNNIVRYFDSFGNLKPTKELLDYLGSNVKLFYNHKRYQNFNTVNCGHLCLEFLEKETFKNEIIKKSG